MLTEQSFATSLVTLNYAEGPDSGPSLILLHGGSARWQSALPLISPLSQNWHIYAPDLRGHGLSGRTPGSYKLQDYASDIATFLEQVVQQPAILFGHSLGGQVALLVAANHPQLVKGLIIGDSPLDLALFRTTLQRDQLRLRYWQAWAGPEHSLEEIAEALKNMPITVEGAPNPVAARHLFGEEHPWFQDMAQQLQLNDPNMLAAVIEFDEMHAGFDCERLLPFITCPTLIIQGSLAHGRLLSDPEVERALTLLPHATVARMETVGHPLHTQEQAPVLLAMETFLKTL